MPEKYIPNWREAEAQRRRPSYSSRQTLRKAPVVAAAPEKYYIQDIEVDRKTYQRYEKQQYDLGDGCKVSLLGVRVYASSKTLAEEYPRKAENAKKIIAQIRAELTKGEKQMSNPKTANDYLKDLKDIYTQSRSSYEAMQKEAEAARDRMNAAYDMLHDPACKDKQTAKIRHEIAQGGIPACGRNPC